MNQQHFKQPPELPQQQEIERKKKSSRDKLFVMVTAIVLGNLSFHLWNTISWLIIAPTSAYLWSLVVANAVAIFGLLYLMRDYTKRMKVEREASGEIQPTPMDRIRRFFGKGRG